MYIIYAILNKSYAETTNFLKSFEDNFTLILNIE